ncbi:MAG: YihA family ribosome biogenesis GTP-binding protein [Bacteroidetes bacterium]|jgi:GTP-binding protein|nr:YihA family ribosome biogenesis GTP-binding protein [Bacteroidota bacterium]MBT6686002.1 YihA family ribosome biogenesis GTP-binding protein [Bacteroidota bacterium]MBT7143784.1 YihA family ribosome biogenesis GTP-binding protein [Bacteroidota bacterium]MBT7490883.1 YihA family ribosome biogenesis GTP-binding protein [Bacteroidota bacterium]
MQIKTSEFVISNTNVRLCPESSFPEYAFIGRSNVGKSSLINMLVGKKKLAKTSGSPGKTQLINHFIINKNWYLVDLPGYGYAKVSKTKRFEFGKTIKNYILKRENLTCLFLLIDSRHNPLKLDLEFIEWLGLKQIPFAIVFTKIDKLTKSQSETNLDLYKTELLKMWEELPEIFISSATTKIGKSDILIYIDRINKELS